MTYGNIYFTFISFFVRGASFGVETNTMVFLGGTLVRVVLMKSMNENEIFVASLLKCE